MASACGRDGSLARERERNSEEDLSILCSGRNSSLTSPTQHTPICSSINNLVGKTSPDPPSVLCVQQLPGGREGGRRTLNTAEKKQEGKEQVVLILCVCALREINGAQKEAPKFH